MRFKFYVCGSCGKLAKSDTNIGLDGETDLPKPCRTKNCFNVGWFSIDTAYVSKLDLLNSLTRQFFSKLITGE